MANDHKAHPSAALPGKEPCATCSGKGIVSNPDARYTEDYANGRSTGQYSTNDPEETDCPTCGGVGSVGPKPAVQSIPQTSDEEPF